MSTINTTKCSSEVSTVNIENERDMFNRKLNTTQDVLINKMDKVKSELNMKFEDKYNSLNENFHTLIKLEQDMIMEQVENTRKLSSWCSDFDKRINDNWNNVNISKCDISQMRDEFYKFQDKVNGLNLAFYEFQLLPWYKKITQKQRIKYAQELIDKFTNNNKNL